MNKWSLHLMGGPPPVLLYTPATAFAFFAFCTMLDLLFLRLSRCAVLHQEIYFICSASPHFSFLLVSYRISQLRLDDLFMLDSMIEEDFLLRFVKILPPRSFSASSKFFPLGRCFPYSHHLIF